MSEVLSDPQTNPDNITTKKTVAAGVSLGLAIIDEMIGVSLDSVTELGEHAELLGAALMNELKL